MIKLDMFSYLSILVAVILIPLMFSMSYKKRLLSMLHLCLLSIGVLDIKINESFAMFKGYGFFVYIIPMMIILIYGYLFLKTKLKS